MTKTNETRPLAACPHCGNDGSGPVEEALHVIMREHYWRDPSWSVQCDKCTATMGYSDSEDEAIDRWNQRQPAAMTYGAVHTDGSRSGGQPIGTNAATANAVRDVLTEHFDPPGVDEVDWNEIAACISGQPAATDAAVVGVVEQLEGKLRNVISHATGGMLQDTSLPLNTICVEISRHRTEIWHQAQAAALRSPPASDAAKPHAADAKTAERVLKAYNGGMVDLEDANNPRGYVTYYRPVVAMQLALAALTPAPPAIESDATVRMRETLPTMCKAFRTTQAGPSGIVMTFKFQSVEQLHQADDEWIAAACKGEPT